MTRIANNLNKMISSGRVPEKELVWWSELRNPEKNVACPIAYSPILPNGTIVKEVQIQARPKVDVPFGEAYLYLMIVKSDGLTNQQLVDSEPLIRWATIPPQWEWMMLGKNINERWPCGIMLRGANTRLAWFGQALDVNEIRMRVSVLYQLP